MATVITQKVHSGHTIYLKIGGIIVGRAQGINGRRSFGTQGVYEIGSIMPQEHINLRYEGTATLDRFFVKNQSLNELGLAPLGEEVLKKNVIDMEVYNKIDGSIVRVYRGCTIGDYSETFRANAICGENATFYYLTCSDNSDSSSVVNGVVGGGTYDSVSLWNSTTASNAK